MVFDITFNYRNLERKNKQQKSQPYKKIKIKFVHLS